jgi:excisionase family DNA binding protein
MDITILTLPEIAKLLRCSERQVRRLVLFRGLPFVQFGKWATITFDKDAVIMWWQSFQQPIPLSAKVKSIKLLRRKQHDRS